MEKLKAIIVDDELDSITTLNWELESFKDKIEVIATFQNPIEAIKAIKKENPDVLFLDIQMPQMSGFELLEKVQGYFSQVIFITAYDEYAIKAIKVSAIDYILKPIESTVLENCINKLSTVLSKDSMQEQLELLLQQMNDANKIDKIALSTLQGLEFIKPSSILYCKSDGNYTYVFLKENKKILVSKTLKEVENILTQRNFFRIHHSYLINLNFLEKYYRGKSAYVIIEGGTQIPVSRNKKTDFLENL